MKKVDTEWRSGSRCKYSSLPKEVVAGADPLVYVDVSLVEDTGCSSIRVVDLQKRKVGWRLECASSRHFDRESEEVCDS